MVKDFLTPATRHRFRVDIGSGLVVVPAFCLAVMLTACAQEKQQPSGEASSALESQRASDELASGEERVALESLGYLTAANPIEGEGVTQYVSGRADNGLTLFESRKERRALLIDVMGNVVHEWTVPTRFWLGHAKLAPNGDLLATLYGGTIGDVGLTRLDWDGNVLWSEPRRYHHDVDPLDDGRVYVLERMATWVNRNGKRLPILDDHLVVLNAAGEAVERQSLYELVGDRIPEARWLAIERHFSETGHPWPETFDPEDMEHWKLVYTNTPYDVFHTNAIEVIREDTADLFKKGDVLTSIRNLDLILVVDMKSKAVRWQWGPGELDHQHHPSMLDNGNILVFDNGSERGFSRVLEIDPRSDQIVWRYQGSPQSAFFSQWQGSCQELENGNVMIVESSEGRIFEVDREGTVLWEYIVPVFGETRDIIYRAQRLAPELEALARGRIRGRS